MTKYKAYICSKDAIYHIPDDNGGVRVYFSSEALIKDKPCCRADDKFGCKVVEITIELPDEIEDGI